MISSSKFMLTCLLASLFLLAKAQNKTTKYFQQTVNTVIDVTLDDSKHELVGEISMEYFNNSLDTLDKLFIHLWGNAYKDQTTAFAKQQLRNKNTKFYYSSEEEKGNFTGIDFSINGKSTAFSYYNDQHDVVLIRLENPLLPGQSLIIETPLNLKIPASFSRLGHVGTSYQMTQWFPKPAVYDQDGWHAMPYLNQGEFYSEFGSYDVTITLPKNYVVAATGTLDSDNEVQFLNRKVEETKARAQDSISDNSFPESSSEMKTIRYLADNVHDFGWFADKRFYVEKGQVTLENGKSVDTYVFYTDTEKKLWQDALSYVDRSVKFYSKHVGNYPYPQATAVQSALSAGGGMEYPMITVIGAMGNAEALDGVITHEVGHNWFYGILGFNEREHPWLDEGINSYYDHRYSQEFYDKGRGLGLPKFLESGMKTTGMQFALMTQMKRGHDQKPSLHSADFENTNYFFSCYEKPAIAFEFLEQYLGAEKFDKVMHSLYEQWEFKHPSPEAVMAHFNKESGEDLSWFFDGFIYSADEINYKISSIKKVDDQYKIKVSNKGDIASPFPITAFKAGAAIATQWYQPTKKSMTVDFPYGEYDYFVIDSSYTMLDINMDNNFKKSKGIIIPTIGLISKMDDPQKKQLFVIPAVLYNEYDGLMLGLALHNYSIPFPKFKGSITSVYGLNSKIVAGVARLQYDQPVKKGVLQRVSYKLLSKQFSLDGSSVTSKFNNYATIVPSVKMHFVHSEGSPWTSTAELKASFVRISNIEFVSDISENIPDDYIFSKLSYAVTKASPLTPLNIEASLEYLDYKSVFGNSEKAIKLDLSARQQFAYMKGKKFSLRGYLGYFPYSSFTGNTSNNETRAGSNANINLVHNGLADYAYEDYFFGRNEESNFASSQVVMKGGGFKLGNIEGGSLGQSDNLAYAFNIVSDIPKIPNYIKLYFDYGAYTSTRQTVDPDNWESIYSGGVMINAFDAIGIYLPIINSDNILGVQEGNYFNKISFTIDINKLDIVDLYNNYRL